MVIRGLHDALQPKSTLMKILSQNLAELVRIEPTTSSLQTMHSPSAL